MQNSTTPTASAGHFKRRLRKGGYYWYYQWDEGGKKRERYVGPVTARLPAQIQDTLTTVIERAQTSRRRRQLVRHA